jgi:hypothetical protein
MVKLLGSILSLEKKAKAAAAAPNIVDQRLPSAGIARRCRNLRNRRKTRCNRSDRRSFSRPTLDQRSNGKRGSAYWPAVFQFHNVGISCQFLLCRRSLARTEANDNFEASSRSRRATVRAINHKPERLGSKIVVGFSLTNARLEYCHGTRIIALASRHSVADHTSGLVARRAARLIVRVLIVRVRRAITQKNLRSAPNVSPHCMFSPQCRQRKYCNV